MNIRVHPRWLTPVVALGLVWVGACAPAAAPSAAPAPAAAQPAGVPAAAQAPPPKTDVTLRLAWFARGYDAPYYLALAKGWYDEGGLNVEIKEGQGSVRTLALVDNGQDTFGTLDAGVMLAGADKGVQSKMVFMFNQRSPNALVFFADAGIRGPQDLRGKSIGTTPGASVTLLFPLYLDAVGLPREDVNVTNVDAAGKVAAFRARKFDLMTGLTNDQVGELEAEGEQVESLAFADSGVNTVSMGAVARNDLIERDPELVRRFVAATQRAWDATIRNPDEAVATIAASFPAYKAAAFKSQLAASIPLLHTRTTDGKPTGWMAQEDWEETNALLVKSGIIQQPARVGDLYTNAFIPGGQ
jgi:NitT/TauT family transport system substrate-binding protein